MPSKKHICDERIETVAVIGAGVMGSGIAQRFAQEGTKVVLADNRPEPLKKAAEDIKATLAEAVTKGLFLDTVVKDIISNITFTQDEKRFSKVDLVIEAVYEDFDAKFEIFKYLDTVCKEDAIFASNTSSLSIEKLSKATKRPERFIGMHFFYHPAKNRLVEVVSAKSTAPGTFEKIWRLGRLLGMVPIVAKDSPGFTVNRLFVPWLNEATRLIDDFVADVPTIESVTKAAFGIGSGPFELMNATGIPIALHSAKGLSELGHFYDPSYVLKRQFLAKRDWDLKGDPDVSRSERVRVRLYGVVFHEACSLLDENVATAEDIERGVRIGLRWEKGPFELMGSLGYDEVQRCIKAFYDRHTYLIMPRSLKTWLALKKPWVFKFVDLVRDGGIARIIVNRPEAMNAINEEVLSQLEQRFATADQDKRVRTIVLEGVGKAFMAGADIRFFIEKIENGDIDDIVAMTKRAHRLTKKIDASNKLVIAKLDGVAVGGGAELAMVADVIVASPRARIGFPETGIGLYPGLGGTQRLPHIVGKELAKYLIFTGKMVDAKTALELGLVQYISTPQELDGLIAGLVVDIQVKRLGHRSKKLRKDLQVIKDLFKDENIKSILKGRSPNVTKFPSEIIETLSLKAPVAIRLANELIDAGMKLDLEQGLELEISHLKEIFSTKDALLGLKSVGKQRPVFTGQ